MGLGPHMERKPFTRSALMARSYLRTAFFIWILTGSILLFANSFQTFDTPTNIEKRKVERDLPITVSNFVVEAFLASLIVIARVRLSLFDFGRLVGHFGLPSFLSLFRWIARVVVHGESAESSSKSSHRVDATGDDFHVGSYNQRIPKRTLGQTIFRVSFRNLTFCSLIGAREEEDTRIERSPPSKQ